jgi:hypothetical protein
MNSQQQSVDSVRLKSLILFCGIIFLLGKMLLIGKVELFQDEVFYWQESRRLDIAYSDMPFMTAWLIHLGTGLLGNTTAGVRLVYLVLGSAVPLLMYWLARPVVDRDNAFYAAGLCLVLPLLGSMGAIAAPDVALIVFNLLALGWFERATRTGSLHYWLLTGLGMALAFATHYRFLPFVAAGAFYLLFTENGRGCLLIGLLPLLYFNLGHDNIAINYHFVERHPWEFKPRGLLFTLEQALLVTPLLFGFLIVTFTRLYRSASEGNDRAMLFVTFAATQAGVYFILSPFMDQSRVSFHWPLSGYLPLLMYMPGLLQSFVSAGSSSPGKRAGRKILVTATLGLAFCASATLLVAHVLQGYYHTLHPQLGRGFIAANSNFAGWHAMAKKVETLLDSKPLPSRPDMLVGDNYVVASQLEFYLGDDFDTFTLDRDKPLKDGRALQLRLWDMDHEGMRKRVGENALAVLLVVERGKYSKRKHRAAIERLCSMFSEASKLDQLSLWDGIKAYEFYYGSGIRAQSGKNRACIEANTPLSVWGG